MIPIQLSQASINSREVSCKWISDFLLGVRLFKDFSSSPELIWFHMVPTSKFCQLRPHVNSNLVICSASLCVGPPQSGTVTVGVAKKS